MAEGAIRDNRTHRPPQAISTVSVAETEHFAPPPSPRQPR